MGGRQAQADDEWAMNGRCDLTQNGVYSLRRSDEFDANEVTHEDR